MISIFLQSFSSIKVIVYPQVRWKAVSHVVIFTGSYLFPSCVRQLDRHYQAVKTMKMDSFLITGFGSHLPFLGNNRRGSIAIAPNIENTTWKPGGNQQGFVVIQERKAPGQGRIQTLPLPWVET